MAYPLYDLFTKIEWVRTRNIPMSENNVNSLMQIINSSPNYENYQIKLTGLSQDNSMAYYNAFSEVVNNSSLVDLLKEIITPNNVRDAINYIENDNTLELTQYCIDSIFEVLDNYPQFKGYTDRLKGLTPSTTQDYISVFDELLYLTQFVFDVSKKVIPNEFL